MNREDGFTLIELLVVMGILGVLSAAVVMVLSPTSILNNARNAAGGGKNNG